MLYPFPPTRGSSSPWGSIQTVTPLGPDAVVVTTASHGGIRVSPSAIARMPQPIHQTAYSDGGWFEEDCDWSLPYLALGLHAFEADPTEGERLRNAAVRMVQRSYPQHADLLGCTAKLGGRSDD